MFRKGGLMESDDHIPLSYISQYSYCPRRAGLLLLEQQWADSSDTIKGIDEHRNVHEQKTKYHHDKVEITEMCITSNLMNISGKCDMVEAYPNEKGSCFPFLDKQKYILYPIEYKHGKLRDEEEYILQLCAQAMCLEEMYDCAIRSGAIFYISSHRRVEIELTAELRNKVKNVCEQLCSMLYSQIIPRPEYSPKCRKCSLNEICCPKICCSVDKYLKEYQNNKEE